MNDGYLRNRRYHRDMSTSLRVAATDVDTTLITGRTGQTVFVQRIIVYIITDAAQSWSFEDSNGTARVIATVTASPGADTRWDFDFGPEGAPLTEAKNLVLNVSAAGLAGHIEVEAYMKPTAALTANVAGTLGGF